MMATPLCRCRVLYIGSAVPTVTKDGLQGIQEPLRERYPVDESVDTKGIDSWMSVWSNGILLEYIEGERMTEAAFFPIQSLHYCAAVRYVNVTGYEVEGGGQKFLPLDSPFANLPDSTHPPIFAAIMRRTTGVKVLECHAFICTNTKAANALVRSCFHAYADSMYLKIDADAVPTLSRNGSILQALKERDSSRSSTPRSSDEGPPPPIRINGEDSASDIDNRTSRKHWQKRQQSGDYDTASISSSLAGRYKKKDRRIVNGSIVGSKKASSELGGSKGGQGALVPVGYWSQRRAGSAQDIYAASTMPRRMSPHQMMPPQFMMHNGPPMGMGPPMIMPPHGEGPPMMMGPHGEGPPMMMGPHGEGPPMMMGSRGEGPPMMMGPHGEGPPMMMPPPHMMGPHGPYPMPPLPGDMYGPMPPMPPPMLMPTPGHPGMPMQPPHDSVYATFPRGAPNGLPPRSFEEPIYMPGQMPPPPPHMIPPNASYHPAAFPPDQYDAYYDYYNNRQGPPLPPDSRNGDHPPRSNLGTNERKKKGKRAGSTASSSRLGGSRAGGRASAEPPADFYQWEDRLVHGEGGIFKKTAYLNEKAFGSAVQQEPWTSTPPVNGRPLTPPADYSPKINGDSSKRLEDQVSNMHIRERSGDGSTRGAYMMY